MATETGFVAPYVPFSTFETGLNKLAALGGIPPKIDHSVFQQMGGVQKGQVISAFKFLGLIDSDGVPSPLLSEFALNKEKRPEALRTIIKQHYPNITEKDLGTMSQGQLDVKLADKAYNVSGGTKQKARSFLLKAAEFSGIPLSKLLTSKGPRGPRKGGKRAANRMERPDTFVPIHPEPKAPPKPGSTEKTIKLKNGGSITLSIDVNILELKGNDRKFVFDLIDKLDVYEHALPLED